MFRIRWIEIGRSVPLHGAVPDAMSKAIGYWETRGFRFDQIQESLANARRGSLWGNMVSFDMSQLIARLSIEDQDEGIVCVIRINPALQMITEWNRAFWDLELTTFESFMLRDDLKEGEWREFDKAWKRAAWKWAASGMRKGNRIHED